MLAKYFLYLLLLLLPLGNLTRLPFGEVAFTALDVILPVVIVTWLLHALLVKKNITLPPHAVLLVLFGMWSLICLVFGLRWIGGMQWAVAAMYWVRWVEYGLLFVITYSLGVEAKEEEKANGTLGTFSLKVIRLLIYAQFVFILLGFIQFVLFPNFSRFVQHGWDPHYYRLLSTFLDPNFAGMFIILGLILIAGLVLFSLYQPARWWILWLLAGMGGVGVILTFSRSTYVAMAAAVGVIGLLRSRLLLLVCVFVGVLSFIFIPRVQTRVLGALEFDETVQLRFASYEQTLTIVKDDPWFGVGFNAFRYAQDREGYFRDDRGVNYSGGHAGAGSDSSLLFLLATTGIPGLVLYMLFVGAVMWNGFKAFFTKTSPLHIRALGLIVSGSFASLMVHTQFVNSLFYTWIMAWMWVILGIFYAEREGDLSASSR